MDVRPTDGPSDPYAVLGVTVDASRDEIVHAFRRHVRELHPDTGTAGADAVTRTRAVIAAYEVLSDPARRAAVDRARKPPVTPAARRPAASSPEPLVVAPLRPSRRPVDPHLRVGPVRVGPSRQRDEGFVDRVSLSDVYDLSDLYTLARRLARRLDAWGPPWR